MAHKEVAAKVLEHRHLAPAKVGGEPLVETREDEALRSARDTARVIDALRGRFPKIQGPRKDDICYATQNRQDAVRELAGRADVVLVVGSVNSSNSNRLRELAEKQGVPAYLLDDAEQIQAQWLQGKNRIGVTAGASAPEVLVQKVIDRLREWGASGVQEQAGREETITFVLPRELRA